jgi:hypothetical protein
LGVKIYPKSIRPKWSFVKSIPDPLDHPVVRRHCPAVPDAQVIDVEAEVTPVPNCVKA